MNVAQLVFTSDLRSVEYLTGSIAVGPIALSKSRLIACAFAAAITALAFVFLLKTKLGKAIRATSQSREVAMVCGIDVQRIHLISFGLACALAASGGTLVAVMVAIQPEMGQIWTFKSFLVIVLGGAATIRRAAGGPHARLVEQLASLFPRRSSRRRSPTSSSCSRCWCDRPASSADVRRDPRAMFMGFLAVLGVALAVYPLFGTGYGVAPWSRSSCGWRSPARGT